MTDEQKSQIELVVRKVLYPHDNVISIETTRNDSSWFIDKSAQPKYLTTVKIKNDDGITRIRIINSLKLLRDFEAVKDKIERTRV